MDWTAAAVISTIALAVIAGVASFALKYPKWYAPVGRYMLTVCGLTAIFQLGMFLGYVFGVSDARSDKVSVDGSIWVLLVTTFLTLVFGGALLLPKQPENSGD